MIRVLVLDDDPEVRYGIYNYLKRDYEVYITKKENEVFNIINQTNINLIIFDYSIISIELKQFISKIKEVNSKISIIIMSSLLEDKERKELFDSSIDDYMEKPIDMLELGFRIGHLLKKQSSQYRKMIEISNLTINCETNTITYKDTTIEFFNKEFQILYHLFSYPNRIFSKEYLVELICNREDDINQSTIRTYINSIRRKIDYIPELNIVTVRGIGYKGIVKK